ncbi:MAG TPA: hypothetical protein VFE50_19505 [Cyclobacteriaceae bacterium]|nr:hypothetical protein [Cyclobacteriaceae bacterium]
MRSWLYSCLTGFTLLCISCIDQSDYELDGISLNPTLALPLVHGELTIADLLRDKDSTHFRTYDDGLLYIYYEDQFSSQGIRDLFSIPNLNINRSFVMPGITVPAHSKDIRSDSINSVVDFGMSPEKLSEVDLNAGGITYTTTLTPSSSRLDYEVAVSIPAFKNRTTGKSLAATIRGNGTIDLSEYRLSLTDNKFDLKLVLIFKKTNSNTVIAPATSVNVAFNFGGLKFNYIKGFLGDQTTSLDAQTLDLGAFDGDIFKDAAISLAQPKVSITVFNGNGLPVDANFVKLEARKPGADPILVVVNPANPVGLAYPTELGKVKETTISVVNVKQLIDYAPTEIYYQADARINKGLTSGNNFVLDSSRLKLKLNVEVPLWGSATGVVLKDTLDLNFDNTETSEITSASLKLKLINQFPLDGNLQFILTDQNFQPIGTLLNAEQTHVIQGSTVDSDGEMQSAGTFNGSIDLDKENLDNIFKAKHIIIAAALQTSRNAAGSATDVKFLADYFLSIEAGIVANLKLNIE